MGQTLDFYATKPLALYRALYRAGSGSLAQVVSNLGLGHVHLIRVSGFRV